MHVERLACLQVDVACVRSVCVYTLSKVTAFLYGFETEEIGT